MAGGDKLRKENPDGKTDYIGSFIYENDELKYIQTGGGRIVVNGINFERQYYLTDHLGNVRVTFDTQGRILQEDSYYPFGMAQEGLNYINNTLLDIENKNNYLYNGKEQDEQTKFFEYGFRDYDSQLGRWHVIDPMAEAYGSYSPYHFAGDNPINSIETNGAVYQSVADIIQTLWDNTPDDGVGTWTSGGGGGGTYNYYASLDEAYGAGAIPGLERDVHFGGYSNASTGQNIKAFIRFMTGKNVAPAYLRVSWEMKPLDEIIENNEYYQTQQQPPRSFTYDQYIEYWENRHGKEMDAHRKYLLTAGCVGVTAAELGYVDPLTDVPPTTYVYSTFEQAQKAAKMIQSVINTTPSLSISTRVIIYSIRFWENSPSMFLPEADGTVDMSFWNPKSSRPPDETGGYTNFDFGLYDDKRNTWWDANHKQPGMKIFEKTLSQFSAHNISDFNRQVFCIALTIEP